MTETLFSCKNEPETRTEDERRLTTFKLKRIERRNATRAEARDRDSANHGRYGRLYMIAVRGLVCGVTVHNIYATSGTSSFKSSL